MPHLAIALAYTFLVLYTVPATSGAHRRILHQPFFPLDSTSSTPPSPPQHSFFPSYPSSTTPTASPGPPFSTSFPANISSLILPHSPSSAPVSKKLVAVTVALSLSAALIAALALFLYFRSRHYRRNIATKFHDNNKSSAGAAAATPSQQQQRHLPKLRNPAPNSAEFLYLGTLANSSSNPGTGARGSSGQSKIRSSPELHPLPPLNGRQQEQPVNNSGVEEDQDEFYSPRASVSGSQSTKAASTEKVVRNGGNLRSSTTSSSSSSASNSPARSASISISPPISTSPKNRMMWPNPNPKSPELIELQVQSQPHAPPASPPLPEMTFSPPYSPSSASTPSPIKEEEEAEESPLLSNSSSSISLSSLPKSPRLSPLVGKIGNSSPGNSPSNSNDSSPRRKSFSSLRLPVFLSGEKRQSSSQSTSMTNSPVSSVGSSSRHSRSYPASPLSNGSNRKMMSPISPSNAVSGPPPPPPPPALRRSQSPPPPPNTSEPVDVKTTPLQSVVVEKLKPQIEDMTPKPKLKPLHWDKVRASSDRETVWDQFRSSSFKLNEEMIETLFVVNTPNPSQKEVARTPIQPWPKQENRVLDPKKAQNIAILLRALNVTTEEVCEALMEGNAETLGTELLESLLKMAPTKEEHLKLLVYKDDSPVNLGHAEKFLKAVIDIPFAFKRIEAMLYVTNFESEVDYLKKSFETLEVACDELRNSKMFLKLLDAILKTGNRMNVGTNRGDAQAFKLDTLLKLVDIKGADGKTTLLHFVVQEIIRTEGQRLSPSTDEPKCRKIGLQIVSSLSSELSNVKKSAAMDSDVLSNDVTKLTSGLGNIGDVARQVTQLQETDRRFSVFMNKFMKTAEEDIFRVQAQERVALSLVKEITEYFHGNSAKEEAHPFRIFMVVRDFLTVLDRVCKEVGMINERTIISSAHRFPIPVNPMLPVPVNPFHPHVLPVFPGQIRSSFSDNGSP